MLVIGCPPEVRLVVVVVVVVPGSGQIILGREGFPHSRVYMHMATNIGELR